MKRTKSCVDSKEKYEMIFLFPLKNTQSEILSKDALELEAWLTEFTQYNII